MPARRRLDQLMVERSLAPTREKAKALILARQVLVNGQPAAKPGHEIDPASVIEILRPLPYVSRAGAKLEAALDHFLISPAGRVCLDIGSSTGGFTDCLLQRGAKLVYAIDTGTGQLDWKLRNDPRVVVRERTNARYLTPSDFPHLPNLAVCDVSFISATMILPALERILRAAREQQEGNSEMVILVKPQFELERNSVGPGGIVRDPALHERACRRIADAVSALGYTCAIIPSPVLGAEGNQEFLLYGAC
jgi:23S rRNA (cytidine1920-2'-O)/16S rRNA (cytidine1409-2'-O)-methyltransferase